MSSKDDKKIYISIYLHNKGFVPAGVITFNTELNYAGFSYFPSYMEADLPPLNPSTLNYRDNYQRHFIVPSSNKQLLDRTFWEMLPQRNDWGDQILISRFPEYAYMSNAEKLYFLGSRTVGGLSAYVQEISNEESVRGLDWLERVHNESIDFFMRDITKIKNIKAITPMTSYGGARPKCMYQDENGDFWIAKFNLPTDPYDMALVEHVAMSMARDSGLNIAESKVIQLSTGENVFLSKRFDRKNDVRFHSLSLFALAPGNDIQKKNPFALGNQASYLSTLIKRFSDFKNLDTANLVVKLLIDLGLNNTDNHLRNLRIILNENNKWELSPIYDVVCNPFSQPHVYNPAGLPLDELYLTNPKLAEQMAKELGIKPEFIQKCIAKVQPVLENWESYCDEVNMTPSDKNKVGNALSLGLYRKEYENKHTIDIESKRKIQINLPKPKPNNVT